MKNTVYSLILGTLLITLVANVSSSLVGLMDSYNGSTNYQEYNMAIEDDGDDPLHPAEKVRV